jgi:putative nucleotidyltransferase with HDIG domain
MVFWPQKSRSRRAEIRKNRPDTYSQSLTRLQQSGVLPSIGVAAAFCLIVIAILMLREEVVPWRPGQPVPYDIVARVDFTFRDKNRLQDQQRLARERSPRIYRANGVKIWDKLEEDLGSLPEKVSVDNAELLAPEIKSNVDAGTISALRQFNTPERRPLFEDAVHTYVTDLKSKLEKTGTIVILPHDARQEELPSDRLIRIQDAGLVKASSTYSAKSPDFRLLAEDAAKQNFRSSTVLQPRIVDLTQALIQPTHVLDELATTEAQNNAAQSVPSNAGDVQYKANQVLVAKKLRPNGFDVADWQLLKAENDWYRRELGLTAEKTTIGLILTAILLTVTLSCYIGNFQRRLLRNHSRAVAIAVLLAAMLLPTQFSAITNVLPPYILDTTSTILVAMVIAIAYDKRFAVGVGTVYALLVTVALDQNIGYFIVQWTGVMMAAFLLDDVRTRSKLIEVGGATALAMMVAMFADGMLKLEPFAFVGRNCLYVGAGALASGFITLGILPFIEKAFRITTSMTLLEIADASHPLLRRLAMEAPGTYNHSLQVATLAEAAAEAIGANSLLCRVASYYHDIGKINKADYFVENQVGGENRHINLSPSVSLLIIIGHVKDGMELAREYNLPTSINHFIPQHHGTTLVEFFYHQAKNRDQGEDAPAISEAQYRYPGPRPKSKETAIVMLADCVESACRAMPEPTASRLETLVHELALKRMLDGQFDDCELTLKEVDHMEKAMVKTLLGIYHGRIAYPSTSTIQTPSITRTA